VDIVLIPPRNQIKGEQSTENGVVG
jgi:hypothetical protein